MLFQWAAVTFSIHTPFKVLFFVKNIGQWNAKSSPKAAYGNFAMRKKNSGSLKKKWKRKGRNGSHFAHTHTHSAKLVVRINRLIHGCWCPYRNWTKHTNMCHRKNTIFYDNNVLLNRLLIWYSIYTTMHIGTVCKCYYMLCGFLCLKYGNGECLPFP